MIEAQRCGSQDLLLNGGPPNLQMSTTVEITSVWNNLPGSEYPPSYLANPCETIPEETAADLIEGLPKGRSAGNTQGTGAPQQDPKTGGGYSDEHPDLPDGLSAGDVAFTEQFRYFTQEMRQQELEKQIDSWFGRPPSLVQTIQTDSSSSSIGPVTPVVSRIMSPATMKLDRVGYAAAEND